MTDDSDGDAVLEYDLDAPRAAIKISHHAHAAQPITNHTTAHQPSSGINYLNHHAPSLHEVNLRMTAVRTCPAVHAWVFSARVHAQGLRVFSKHVNQPTKQPTNQPTNQPNNQPTNQHAHRHTHHTHTCARAHLVAAAQPQVCSDCAGRAASSCDGKTVCCCVQRYRQRT